MPVGEPDLSTRPSIDETIAAERLRIADELQDLIASTMSGMILQAQRVDQTDEGSPDELRQTLRDIALDGQQTLKSMRAIVRGLRAVHPSAA
ncbi:histidine kinase dimerization/phosphoacceptor domain-containing protein [Kineosporia rhizophila]|uniref:histidine kinase n=1 Tax=Kineosporia TaxID=49184 RepID=UPI001E40EC4F|nr:MULTISPECIES: histidine kinase dimerization/phosphoacceptor domain-containing protein [Kineosporia]MCE0539365.1 histidine kinase dimerization/phosphoacceptor domain-containing protein [Kineosporia rhizophila]